VVSVRVGMLGVFRGRIGFVGLLLVLWERELGCVSSARSFRAKLRRQVR